MPSWIVHGSASSDTKTQTKTSPFLRPSCIGFTWFSILVMLTSNMEISFSTSQDAFNLLFDMFLLLVLISYFDLAMVSFFFFCFSLVYSIVLFLSCFLNSVFLLKKQLCFKPPEHLHHQMGCSQNLLISLFLPVPF